MAKTPYDVPQNNEGIEPLLWRIATLLWRWIGPGKRWETKAITVGGGAGYTTFPAGKGVKCVLILNNTGEKLDIRSAGAADNPAILFGSATTFPVPLPIYPASGADEISVRRTAGTAGNLTGLTAIYQY